VSRSSATPAGRTRRPRVHATLVAALGHAILAGTWAPGAALPSEAALLRRHRVGRNALREALKVLQSKGLISCRPRVGTVVLPRALWRLLDAEVLAWGQGTAAYDGFISGLTEARMAFEPAAAALAAARASARELSLIEAACESMADSDDAGHAEADARFHAAVLAASGNQVFAQLGPLLHAALTSVFSVTDRWMSRDLALGYHRAVLDAIRQRDPERARSAMLRLLSPVSAAAARQAAPARGLGAIAAPARRPAHSGRPR
jgi:GntR family galactonate operon transcriptional repressor